MRLIIAMSLICFGATLAQAQPIEDASVTTSAGKEVQLGGYAAFKRDCSGGTAVDLRPAGDQRGGVITITLGALSTSRVRGCSTVTSPARIISYRPNPGFVGTDRVTFDVIDTATGNAQAHSVKVEVMP